MLTIQLEIVHVNTSMDANGYWRDLVYVFPAHGLRRKIVPQVHGGYLPLDFFPRGVLSKLLELVLRSVDIVIVLSQESLHAYRKFASSLKLKVIPNAIQLVADPLSKQAPFSSEKPLRLVYVGRLDECKGAFDILQAVILLKKRGTKVSLVIAGSGPDEPRMRMFVDQASLQNIVTFIGAVHETERDLIGERSDLFIFPTRREALPYSLLESMATRTPARVSCAGAIPDVIQDGVHRIFIRCMDPDSLANTIARLNSDRQAIYRMGEASRQRIVGFYTIARLADDLARTYLNLLKRDN
jgi:glycosyltransferase involved in cell wall biosynthesis